MPAVSVYEVFKVLLREAGEEAAIQGAAAMQRGRLVELTIQRALAAAAFSLRHSLPMADSMILAAAREHGATVWTLDEDFKGLENVRYFARK
jgi:predicted nucleic acid-binding protein